MRSLSRLVKGSFINVGQSFDYRPAPEQLPVLCAQTEDGAEDERAQLENLRAELDRDQRAMREGMRREAEAIRAEAAEQGYQAGYEQGRAQALEENGRSLAEIKRLAQEIERDRQTLIAREEQNLIDLALEIARKVVADRIERDDEAFVRIFRQAVEGLSDQKTVQLTVSQQDIEFATAHAQRLCEMVRDAEKLTLRVIEDVPKGTVIVDTDDVRIDASAHRQLEAIEQAIEDARYAGETEEGEA